MANAEVLRTSKEIALTKKAEEKEKGEAAPPHLIGQEDSLQFSTLMPSKTFQRNRKKFGWRTST